MAPSWPRRPPDPPRRARSSSLTIGVTSQPECPQAESPPLRVVRRTGAAHVLAALPAQRACDLVGRDLAAQDGGSEIRSALAPKPSDQVAATCAAMTRH